MNKARERMKSRPGYTRLLSRSALAPALSGGGSQAVGGVDAHVGKSRITLRCLGPFTPASLSCLLYTERGLEFRRVSAVNSKAVFAHGCPLVTGLPPPGFQCRGPVEVTVKRIRARVAVKVVAEVCD